MGDWLSSTAYIEKRKEELKNRIELLKKKYGRSPSLSVVLVGNNKASISYVKRKEKFAKEIGMKAETLRFDNINEKDLLSLINKLNNDVDVDGFIIQLPLPEDIDVNRIIESISPAKDVDGFHPYNLGKLFRGEDALFPCTPFGIVNFLKFNKFELAGKNAVIIGRSNLVGKPLSILLLKENMTVTITHSKTKNLSQKCSNADFLFVAAGRPLMVTPEYVKQGAVVIDVGVNALTDSNIVKKELKSLPQKIKLFEKKGYVLVGDVHPEVVKKASYLTPVPKGIGPITVLTLIENTIKAFENRVG